MRLYKKAAVCLLAAAMALSMMTACGPTGSGSNGSNGGNNDTSQGSGDKDDTDDKGDNKDDNGDNKDDQGDKKDDQDNSVIPEDPKAVTWDTSLTKKCYTAVSADDFKVTGLFATGGAFGYATQGTKQIMFEQEDQNTMIAFYTPDGESLYLTSYKPTDNATVNTLTWTNVEEYGKDTGMTDEQIAENKQETLAELKAMKNMIYIADKVVPLTFSAENYTDTLAQEFYKENITANVDGVAYTYEFYYTAKDMSSNGQVVYKKGDMTSICRINGGTTTQLFVSAQPSRCEATTFPTVK